MFAIYHWWNFNVAAFYLFAWVGKMVSDAAAWKSWDNRPINELWRHSSNTDSVLTITAACEIKHQNQQKRMSSIDFCQNSTTVPGINYSRQTSNSSGGWLIEISHSLSNFTEKCWKTKEWKTKILRSPAKHFSGRGNCDATHSLPSISASKTENCF